MPSSLNLIPSPTNANEYDSNYNQILHDGTWKDLKAPSGYDSGINTRDLTDEWGVGITRQWGHSLDQYINTYGTEDVKNVYEIASKFLSDDLSLIEKGIQGDLTYEQVENGLDDSKNTFRNGVSLYLARKLGVPGAELAKKVIDGYDRIVTGIHSINFVFYPESLSNSGGLAPESISAPHTIYGQTAQSFAPGSPVYINLGDQHQVAVDYINAGHSALI